MQAMRVHVRERNRRMAWELSLDSYGGFHYVRCAKVGAQLLDRLWRARVRQSGNGGNQRKEIRIGDYVLLLNDAVVPSCT